MRLLICLTFIIFAINVCKGEICNEDGEEDGERKLVSVVALLRHGDRAPYSSFPSDHYFNLSYWPMGHGQLTDKGKDRMFRVGEWLRARYNSFLSQEYSPKDIYVRSTDVDRCLISAFIALAALYPPLGSNSQKIWQPIPIHTKAFREDEILGMRNECPKYTKLYHKTFKTEYFKNITLANAAFLSYVSNHSGWTDVDLDEIKVLQTIVDIYKSYNDLYLPQWYDNLNKGALQRLAGVKHESFTHTTALKRLVTGPFWSTLIRYFDDVINKTDIPKFIMLVSHDTTIVALLNSMGVYDSVLPGFGDTLIWELWNGSQGGYYVKVVYKRDGSKPQNLKIMGCNVKCDYKRFKKALEAITVDVATWQKECLGTGVRDVARGTISKIRKIWLSKSVNYKQQPFSVT